ASYGRRIGLEDASDHDAVREHVEIILIPFAGSRLISLAHTAGYELANHRFLVCCVYRSTTRPSASVVATLTHADRMFPDSGARFWRVRGRCAGARRGAA